MSILDTVK